MPASQTSLTPEYEVEKAKQEKIAAELAKDAPVKTATQTAGTPAEEAPEPEPTVTLRPVDVDVYPLGVSIVGVEDELIFADENATVDIPASAAEQTIYIEQVEIVA